MSIKDKYQRYFDIYFDPNSDPTSLDKLENELNNHPDIDKFWTQSLAKNRHNIPKDYAEWAIDQCGFEINIDIDRMTYALEQYYENASLFCNGVIEVMKYGWDVKKTPSVEWNVVLCYAVRKSYAEDDDEEN